MKTIKILWVDDKFQDPNGSFTKTVDSDILECQDIDNTIIVNKLSNRKDFLRELSTNNKYAVIILDAETSDEVNDTPDIKTFDLHLRPIDKLNYSVLKYVYSSYPDQVAKMATEYKFEIRDKSEISPYDLLVEIKDSISLKFPLVPELFLSIQDGFIETTNENRMRNIMDSYYDTNKTPLDDMRYILEDIFDHLINMQLINMQNMQLINRGALSNSSSLNAKVKYLTAGRDINGNAFVPYHVCPIEVKYAIQSLAPCSQLYHHNQTTAGNRMDSSLFKSDYEAFFKEMAYNAFFITMRWYYHFMLNQRNSPSNGNFRDRQRTYYT